MKNYLSIGEVSRIKGVSIKSLRYYDKLGILPPAYINKETGYRYYSLEQLLIIDLIMVCIDLDIPLKNFKNYIAHNQDINIELLLADGEKIVTEKIYRLKNIVKFLNKVSEHITNTNRIKAIPGEFTEYFPKRYFLTSDWNNDYYDIRAFRSKLTGLYKQCKEHNLTDSFNQGFLFLYQNNTRICKVFLEIPEFITAIENLLIIPNGDFLCKVIDGDTLEEKYLTDKSYPDGSIFIAKELYDMNINCHLVPFEIQLLITKNEK